ncbi:hypothetical protein DMUE_0732 [Dictyocoela muelleri]|nr:hypothetical protein DMUE_0732 [Dictyocoela muelleri]
MPNYFLKNNWASFDRRPQNLVRNSNHRILFLPSYSPLLNPMENLFSQWKNRVRAADCQTENDLINKIHNALNEISNIHCYNYYNHMLKFLSRCLNKEEMMDG